MASTLADFFKGVDQRLPTGLEIGRRRELLRLQQDQAESAKQKREAVESDVKSLTGTFAESEQEALGDQTLGATLASFEEILQDPNPVTRKASFEVFKPELKKNFGDNAPQLFQQFIAKPEEGLKAFNSLNASISENADIGLNEVQQTLKDPAATASALNSAGRNSGRELNARAAERAGITRQLRRNRQEIIRLQKQPIQTREGLKLRQDAIKDLVAQNRNLVSQLGQSTSTTLAAGSKLVDEVSGETIAQGSADVAGTVLTDNQGNQFVLDKTNKKLVPVGTGTGSPAVKRGVEATSGDQLFGTKSQQGKEFIGVLGKVDNASEIAGLATQLGEIADLNENAVRLAGFATTVNNAVSIVEGFMDLPIVDSDGKESTVEAQINNETARKLLQKIAGGDAVSQSVAITLAYRIARQNDDKGRISDPDYNAALRSIGGDIRDPKIRKRVLKRVTNNSFDKSIREIRNRSGLTVPKEEASRMIENLRQQKIKFNEDFGTEKTETKSEEQQELEALMEEKRRRAN